MIDWKFGSGLIGTRCCFPTVLPVWAFPIVLDISQRSGYLPTLPTSFTRNLLRHLPCVLLYAVQALCPLTPHTR